MMVGSVICKTAIVLSYGEADGAGISTGVQAALKRENLRKLRPLKGKHVTQHVELCDRGINGFEARLICNR